MKNMLFILLLLLLLSSSMEVFSQIQFKSESKNGTSDYFLMNKSLESSVDSNFDRKKGYKPLRRWQNFWASRIDSSGKIPNTYKIYQDYQQFKKKNKSNIPLSSGSWTEIGPRSPQIGSNKLVSGSGRISCLAFSPNDSNLIWAGSASGGLWKTTDKGISWEVEPFTEFLSMGVSDIAVSKSNPDIIYVATGDVDGGSFFGCFSLGLIKSTDGGRNWEILDLGFEYSSSMFISKVIVNPLNSDILFVSTSNSIMKSSDGGKNWMVQIDGHFFRDLMFKPDDPNTIYATDYSISDGASVFKSDDGGDSWFIMKHYENANRIKLAVSKFDSEYLLALASNNHSNSFESLYLSRSAGVAWEKMLDDTTDYNFLVQAQGFFNLVLGFSPYNRDEYYIGGVWLYKGNLKSNEFTAAPAVLHVDMHDLKFSPHDSLLYVANDGGVYRTNDDLKESVNISTNLGVTQFYRIGLNQANERIFYGGSQDNNVCEWFYGEWKYYWGGDGMESFVDPRNPSLIYFSTQRGVLYNSHDGMLWVPTNEQKPWVTAFLPHPMNYDKIYCGYENIWISDYRGKDWRKISDFKDTLIITSITVSKNDSNLIYASNNKNIYKSINMGESWEKIYQTPAYASWLKLDRDNGLWMSFGRFTTGEKVLFYKDGTIKNHSFNLPNIPVNCIEIDSLSGRIYIGTDLGVFDKMPEDTLWNITGDNLPAVIVNELEINYGTGKLFAATFGRGIWNFDLFDCMIARPELVLQEKYYFCPGDEYILRVKDPNPNYQYLWNDGSIGAEKSLTKSGVYYVSAMNSRNCVSASDSVYIWKPYTPFISLTLMSSNPICEGDTASILARFGINQPIKRSGWSNGLVDDLGKFTETGKYYFWLEDVFGCYAFSDTVSITVLPNPPKPVLSKSGHWLNSTKAYRYVWYRNGERIPDFTGESLYLYEPGTYIVLVRDSNFCFAQSDEFVVSFDSDSANYLQYKLYPNPSAGNYTMELNLLRESELEITVYNSIGELLSEKQYPPSIGYMYETIDLTRFSQGSYYLYIKSKFGRLQKILVKVD